MKKAHLPGVVCALTLFAMSSSASAKLVASDDTADASTGQSYALTFAVSPASFSDVEQTSDVFGDFAQTQSGEHTDNPAESAVQTGTQTNSHMDLWLLLLVAAVAGVLSEIFHRKSTNA